MTLPGGPADKLGNRYEMWWTLSVFVRLLQGHADAIRIEDPSVVKTEFVVTTGSRRELHQVKRSHTSGKWSLAALRTDGLLEAIGSQLADDDDRFVFVSTSHALELADLCDAVRNARSPEEFKGAFLKAAKRNAHWERLLEDWKCDERTAMDYLRRIEVHAIDDRQIEEKVMWGIRALFLANPKDVADTLRGIAEDSVHHTITREALVDRLSQRGYTLRRLTDPTSAGVAVRTATDRYLDGARRKLIRDQLVPRQATQSLLSRLGDTATESVMTGRAGSGKTACVVEVVDALRERNVPVLAFRLDHFVSASTTANLGKLLDLEESPILVLTAAVEAAGRPGVLVVDQLDAVSTMSGRTSAAFDLVEQLLFEARGSRARAAIHVVVVCREFDWENDPRMRGLLPESHAPIGVTDFSDDEVKKILAGTGFETRAFSDRQLRVLRLPQNLSLFLDAGFDLSCTPSFNTAKEILDRYWSVKRRLVADRAPSQDQWKAVMESLCEEMTSTQQLSVRKEKLDAFSPNYVDQLASEGVISFDGRRYGFGHESFFDYVFARLFVARRESLVALLGASEQHLFRRGQVRQVLTHLRDADCTRYVEELHHLLSHDGIRTHLKDLVFTLLADVTNPTDGEWAVWEQSLEPALTAIGHGMPNKDMLSGLAWRRFFASRSWFAEIDRREVIEGWLASDNDRFADMAVNYLRFHQRHSPDRVAALLEPYVDRSAEWRLRFRSLMESAERHTSRPFFDLFLRLIDNGTLDDARDRFATNGTFWLMLYSLGEQRPEWVSEVLAHRLRRRLTLVRATGTELRAGALLDHDQFMSEPVEKSCQNAPAAFVEHVLPAVLEISDAAVTGDKPPKLDAVWLIPFKSEHLDGEHACLSGLASALAVVARTGAVPLRDIIEDLRRRDTYTANFLLLSLYRGAGSRYADEAIALLCDQPWRFDCGFSDSPNWCAMETIRAVIPHCTMENRERIEAVILQYVSPHEQTLQGYKQFGTTRFDLLSAIPPELRSRNANARFEELARKFGDPAGEPQGIVVSTVVAPIQEKATLVMTDEQWLRAISKYPSENRIDFSADEPRGGARELARVLQARTKEAPNRFARLALRFPADANPVYLNEMLGALKENEAVASDLKLQLCRKAFDEARSDCGRAVADVLGQMEDALPDDAIEMIDWLATQDDDPAVERWTQDGDGQGHYDGDPYFHGINTTRGRAVEAIRDLILRDAVYIERFRTTLDKIVQDPSAAVRSCVAGILRAIASHDPSLGMSLFQGMDLSEDRLLATPHVYEFIRGRLNNGLSELRPIIERMLSSSEPDVREAGARLACIGTLRDESAEDLATKALRGDVRCRVGAAKVASVNIANPEHRVRCEAMLVLLFADVDVDVRREAASCFRYLSAEVLGRYDDLIAAFCDSPAFKDAHFQLLHALEHSRERLPGTTCVVCEKYLRHLSDTAGGLGTGQFAHAHTVVKLIFRTYQQHQNDEWTRRSLDLIDLLCTEGIADAGSELEKFER